MNAKYNLIILFFACSLYSISQIKGNGVKDIEGFFYESVIIGNQEWMASDLRTSKYSNGDKIIDGQDLNTWYQADGQKTGAFCILNNDQAYAKERGKIYNGHTLYDIRNVCPSGWRVPTDNDFFELEKFLGLPEIELNNWGQRGEIQKVGVKLKSKGIIQYNTGLWDLSGTSPGQDLYGFNAYPHGARLAGGNFCCDNGSVNYLAKNSTNDGIIRRNLSFNVDGIIRYGEPMANGNQIRCLKDKCTSIIYDTIKVTIYDTVKVSVADTLIITTSVLDINSQKTLQKIKIFPNPTSSFLHIEYEDYIKLNGFSIKIINSIGNEVFSSNINQEKHTIDLKNFGGNGIYFLKIIDEKQNILEVKKILLK